MALLKIENLSFTYEGEESRVLDGIDLEIEQGDFVLLCGASGCGKTTLLKMLKKQLRPFGTLQGSISFDGSDLESLDQRRAVSDIGCVMQDPHRQIVTHKVWHELAFGLESLGEKPSLISRKCAEICSYFGISDLCNRECALLSGGQKQLVCLASVTVLSPRLLLLDEPTSQLDPVSAREFIAHLRQLNEELGITIIIAEHRLEELFSIANKIVLMDKGRICASGSTDELCALLGSSHGEHRMYSALPTPVKLFLALEGKGKCPMNVREGRKFLRDNYENRITSLEAPQKVKESKDKPSLEIKGGYFRYERSTPDVLSGVDFKAYEGEFCCIMGANGSGKTTLLSVLAGVRKLYKGKVSYFKKNANAPRQISDTVGMLPQDPRSLFIANSVYEELAELCSLKGLNKNDICDKVNGIAKRLELTYLFNRHPFDLSGGEAQRLAFAKLLITDPPIILLDEPTKGLDPFAKEELARIIEELTQEGKTVIAVTHDIEFAASYAHRCAMFFDGQIVSDGESDDFFSRNTYYTTCAHRISNGYYEGCVSLDSLVRLCRANGKRAVAEK